MKSKVEKVALPKSKRMYRVERFIPTECPRCRQRFLQDGLDYLRLFGDVEVERKVVRATYGYDLIVCTGCQNMTARVSIEAYQVTSQRRAVTLLREGFVNLQRVEVFGDNADDRHEVFTPMPNLRVRDLKVG